MRGHPYFLMIICEICEICAKILHLWEFEPLDVAEVLTVRQVLVLRVHADGALVLSELAGRELCLEGVVVTLVTGHVERLYIEDLLVAVLIEANIDLLQTNGIIETLLVDDILDVV